MDRYDEERLEHAAADSPVDPDPEPPRETQDAHGGSMAPGLVDDTGHQVADVPTADTPSEPLP